MNKRWLLILGMGILSIQTLKAQEIMDLYPGEIPGSKTAASYKEVQTISNGKLTSVAKVVHPTLSLYKPASGKGNGTAVIICPGGGYDHLAMGHEGDEVARKFAGLGVTAFVLKYRLPSDSIMVDKSFGPLQDAEQAIYLVRKNAGTWNINPAKVGIMGFSAGGHLASTLKI
jgi:acetyl esterase/lipase